MRKAALLAAKDLKHVAPLLAAVLPLLFLFATHDVERLVLHKTALAAAAWEALFLATPLLIWSLVAMVIHGESLVGDRQYWITRPFTWQQLAAAKAMVILVSINLPLFLFQAYALAASGISPLTYLADLLWRQLFFSAFFLLPAAALAAVTRTHGQFAVSLLLAVSPFAALAYYEWDTPLWTEVTALAAIVTAGTLGALAAQYGRRYLGAARTLLAATVLSCLAVVISHWTSIYEPFSVSRAVQFTLDPAPRADTDAIYLNRPQAIELPVVAEGLPEGLEPAINSYRIAVQGGNSPAFHSDISAVSFHGWSENRGVLQIVLGPESSRRLNGESVTVEGRIYFTLMRSGGVLDTSPDTVRIAGFGVCSRSRALCLSPQPHAALSLVPAEGKALPDQFGRFVPIADTYAPFPASPALYPLESYHYEPTLGRLLVERPAGLFRADFRFERITVALGRPY